MAEAEQDRPLAPTRVHPSSSSSNEEEAVDKTMRRKRRIKLCGWLTLALLLVKIIVIVILALTVFKVKDPKVKLKGITITNLDVGVQTPTPQVNLNMSMIMGMSIKNPNVASFKISNTSTTTVYYRGVAVADAGIPAANVKACRTTVMDVTVVVLADRLASNPDLYEDVIMMGKMDMSTYSVIKGRVKIWFIKKHVEVKMNCTMTINISSRDMEDLSCKYKVYI